MFALSAGLRVRLNALLSSPPGATTWPKADCLPQPGWGLVDFILQEGRCRWPNLHFWGNLTCLASYCYYYAGGGAVLDG